MLPIIKIQILTHFRCKITRYFPLSKCQEPNKLLVVDNLLQNNTKRRQMNPHPHQQLPQALPPAVEPGKSTVYVSNLPYDVKSFDIQQAFETFGRVVKVTLLTVKETRRSKGVAFVLFYKEEDAHRCVDEANNATMFGQTLKVSIARDNGRGPSAVKRPAYEPRLQAPALFRRRYE